LPHPYGMSDVLLPGVASQHQSLDAARFSTSRSARFRRIEVASSHLRPWDAGGTSPSFPPFFPPPAHSVSMKRSTKPIGTSSSRRHGLQHECPVTPYLPPARASAAHAHYDEQVVVLFFFPKFMCSGPCPPPPTTRMPPCALSYTQKLKHPHRCKVSTYTLSMPPSRTPPSRAPTKAMHTHDTCGLWRLVVLWVFELVSPSFVFFFQFCAFAHTLDMHPNINLARPHPCLARR